MKIETIKTKLLDFVYPPVCSICGEISNQTICSKCRPKLNEWKACKKHIYLTKEFEEHFYVLWYQDWVKEKLVSYKFSEKTYLCEGFVKILLNDQKVCAFLENYDIMIPVPISRKRLRQRGYNQVSLIGKQIAKHTKQLEYNEHILVKIKDTKPQSLLDKEKRKINLEGAYVVKNENFILNKKVLLFDDVFTTGSTMNACSKVLKQAGVKLVGALTIAKD